MYPETIFQVLQDVEGVVHSYVEVRSTADGADDVLVVVGAEKTIDKQHIESLLQARLRVVPAVLIKPGAEVAEVMTREGGHKPKKFFDYRS
jgi:formylmethanofuran:tetrahydromethanopterin formyltransferase